MRNPLRRVRPSVRVYGGFRDSYLTLGSPGSGKTNWLALTGLAAPGAALFTSTRADLADHTARARARKGPVWFLNPGGEGGYPNTLRWSPLAGCGDPRMAMEAAGALIHAAPHDPSGKDAHWDGLSKRMLQYLLHAAALDLGADIVTVKDWASAPARAGKAAEILASGPAPQWAEGLAALVFTSSSDERYWSAISSGVMAALEWLDDPALADLACPAPGEEFDAAQWIREQGTVYLITADTPHNPVVPYNACFVNYAWNTMKRMAASPAETCSFRLRLDPPAFLVLDEPAISAKNPLDKWLAEAGGHGIVIATGFQSLAQLPGGWGEHGGQTIIDNSTVKILFGGSTNPDLLRMASGWGGMRDTWDHSTGPDGSKTKTPRQEPAFPEERLRQLPLGQAFVVHRSTRAFIADIRPVHQHSLYERATGTDFPGPWRAPAARPAIGPPRREAIPMPGAAPEPPALQGHRDAPAPLTVPGILEPQGAGK